MDVLDRLPCIKQGLWFYGGVTCCHVRSMMECFYVRHDLPHAPRLPAAWHDGGAALSLREAVFLAERRLGPSIHWND